MGIAMLHPALCRIIYRRSTEITSLLLYFVYCTLLIFSFLENDVVPRMCIASIEALKNTTEQLLSQADNNFQRMYQLFNVGNALGDEYSQKISRFVKAKEVDFSKVQIDLTVHEKLVPPGIEVGDTMFICRKSVLDVQAKEYKTIHDGEIKARFLHRNYHWFGNVHRSYANCI